LQGLNREYCDNIDGMNLIEDTLYLPSNDTLEYEGVLPEIESLENHLGITFCIYLPLNLSGTKGNYPPISEGALVLIHFYLLIPVVFFFNYTWTISLLDNPLCVDVGYFLLNQPGISRHIRNNRFKRSLSESK
jgi:hypothetical protein